MRHTAGKPVSVMGAKKENKTAVVQSKDQFLSVSLHKLDYTWEKNSNFLSTGHWSPYSMKKITFKLVENHSQKSSPNSSQYQSDTLKFQNLDFFVHPPRVLCLQ